ncbi:MAG: AraC family transcriptional regulator [Pseudomonadota bacterium]
MDTTQIQYRDRDIVARGQASFASRTGETIGAGWRRVQTLVADQADHGEPSSSKDFHLVEVCLDGRLVSEIVLTPETSEPIRTTLIPGTLQVRKRGTAARYATDGHFKLQQILIDDSVFREAAAAIAPDDPSQLAPPIVSGVFDPGLKALADALLDEARHPTLGGDLYADTLAQQIAIRILRRRFETKDAGHARRRELSAEDLARLNDHMDSDLAGAGGTDAMAEAIGMETFAFSRAFRETTGQSPHQYLIDRRIGRAKELLRQGRIPLAEIAYATGFSSQSHMTATFTKRVGQSPGRWRRMRMTG